MSQYFAKRAKIMSEIVSDNLSTSGMLGNAEKDRYMYDGQKQLSAHILVDKLRFSLSLVPLSWYSETN